ncbi:MAG: hypothetical protein QGF25_01215 [Candidatus Woesearchaeota archaeon]|jgi:hypothetical protein|nr:hypothetical protein [Candidatus Woesearchaeota archaeon]MDP7466852.1 hypothetical protein [Candidatus Woesearchaeota archaeon]
MAMFTSLAVILERIGFVTVLLPFVLVFAIVYGILHQTKVLSDRKNLNAMVAFVIGMFVVASLQLVEQLNTIVAWMSIVVIVLLFVVMIFGVSGIKIDKKKWYWHVILVAVIGVILAVVLSTIFKPGRLLNFVTAPFVMSALLAIIMVGVIIFLVKGEKTTSSGSTTAPTPSAPAPTPRTPAPAQQPAGPRQPSPEQSAKMKQRAARMSPQAQQALTQLGQTPREQHGDLMDSLPMEILEELQANGFVSR